jgi:ABC-type glycerol-3-phosphate transport system permease component
MAIMSDAQNSAVGAWRISIGLLFTASVAILAFDTSWNAYLLPLLVFNDPNHFTLPLGDQGVRHTVRRRGDD